MVGAQGLEPRTSRCVWKASCPPSHYAVRHRRISSTRPKTQPYPNCPRYAHRLPGCTRIGPRNVTSVLPTLFESVPIFAIVAVSSTPALTSAGLYFRLRRSANRTCSCLRPYCFSPPQSGTPLPWTSLKTFRRRIRVERLAQHDAALAMVLALTKELHRSRDREIARHLAPHILELILLRPHIDMPADLVLPRSGAEPARSFPAGPPTSPELVNAPKFSLCANAPDTSADTTQKRSNASR